MKFDIFYFRSTVPDLSFDTLNKSTEWMEVNRITGVVVIRYPEGAKVELVWYNQGRRR